MITKDELGVLQKRFEPERQAKQSHHRYLEKLREEFESRFPQDRIPLLSLDDYVEGKGSKDSFCYWVECKTSELGRIQSRNSSKFGVFFDKKTQRYKVTSKFENEDSAIIFLRKQIVRLLEAGRAKNLEVIRQIDISPMFKGKILFLYYPEKYLNIFSEKYIDHFLRAIGLPVANNTPDVLEKRELLHAFKSNDEIMSKWTMYEFTNFLYYAWQSPISESRDSTLVADIEKIKSSESDPTTMQALVNARVGQGKFGLAVRKRWNHRCSVTGSSTKVALEASHILSWADSNDAQRLDPNNGLLLTANLHKLFDAGLISFDDSGKMLVSSKLSQSEQEIFGVVGKQLSKKPSAKTANYLACHRTKFFEWTIASQTGEHAMNIGVKP